MSAGLDVFRHFEARNLFSNANQFVYSFLVKFSFN